MPRHQFIICYTGNKYIESHLLNYDDFKNYEVIHELYGGSFGFSRWLYFEDIKRDIKREYVIYDNDELLINFYNYIKGLSKEELQEFYNKYNDIQKIYKEKKHLTLNDLIKTENKYLNYMIFMNNFNSRFKRAIIKKFDEDYYNMFKQCKFIYKSTTDELDIKDGELIYLDPPYKNSYNDAYSNNDENYIEIICNIYKKYNHVLFIHIHEYCINELLKEYLFKQEKKMYQTTKKYRIHNIYLKK